MIKLNGFKEVMPSANEAVAGFIIFSSEPLIIRNIEDLPDGDGSWTTKEPFKIKILKKPANQPAKKIINLYCTDPETGRPDIGCDWP